MDWHSPREEAPCSPGEQYQPSYPTRVLKASKNHFFPSRSTALIPRCAPEQATRLEDHDYSNRGSGNVNSAIDQGSVAARYVPLMELVSKGIQTNYADAPYRLT